MYVTDTFWTTVCAMFGQKNDSNTIPMLRKWQEFEGGNAEWNPLNSTERWDGSTNYNSAGVQNYRSQEDGINATVATLRNGHYPSIIWAIENNVPEESWTKAPIPAQIDTWGTHGFAAYLRTLTPTPTPTPPDIFKEKEYMIVRADNGDYLLHGGKMCGITTGTEDGKLLAIGIPIWDIRGDVLQYERLRATYPSVDPPEDAPTPPVVAPTPPPVA